MSLLHVYTSIAVFKIITDFMVPGQWSFDPGQWKLNAKKPNWLVTKSQHRLPFEIGIASLSVKSDLGL